MAESSIKARGFRCTDEEWDMIKSQADKQGMRVHDFVTGLVRKQCEEGGGQQDSDRRLLIQIARASYYCVAATNEKMPTEWQTEWMQKAKDKFPHTEGEA